MTVIMVTNWPGEFDVLVCNICCVVEKNATVFWDGQDQV